MAIRLISAPATGSNVPGTRTVTRRTPAGFCCADSHKTISTSNPRMGASWISTKAGTQKAQGRQGAQTKQLCLLRFAYVLFVILPVCRFRDTVKSGS
jgi:hypothetical protein